MGARLGKGRGVTETYSRSGARTESRLITAVLLLKVVAGISGLQSVLTDQP